jgi:hypothetical protein
MEVAYANEMITGMNIGDQLEITLVLKIKKVLDVDTYVIKSQTAQVIKSDSTTRPLINIFSGGSATDETKSSELIKIMPRSNHRKTRQIHNKTFSNRRRMIDV